MKKIIGVLCQGPSFSGWGLLLWSVWDREALGLMGAYVERVLGLWGDGQAGARWSQTTKWHWRVLHKEVTWSDLHSRNIPPATMLTLFGGGDELGKEYSGSRNWDSEQLWEFKCSRAEEQKWDVFLYWFPPHWLYSFGPPSKLIWVQNVCINLIVLHEFYEASSGKGTIKKARRPLLRLQLLRLCQLPETANAQSTVIITMCKNAWTTGVLRVWVWCVVHVVAMGVSSSGKDIRKYTCPWSLFHFLDMMLNGEGRA